MSANIKDIKTKRTKEVHELTYIEKVALSAGCSTTMVGYVLRGERNQETATAQRILIAAEVIKEKENHLLQEVKRLVKL